MGPAHFENFKFQLQTVKQIERYFVKALLRMWGNHGYSAGNMVLLL